MLETCFSTAPGVTTIARAIAAFVRPSAISSMTSRSRGVRLASGPSPPLPPPRARTSSVTTSRSSTVPPAATRAIASRNARTSPTRSLSR
jgi:hypothetical protein